MVDLSAFFDLISFHLIDSMKLKIKPTTGGETFEVEVGSASDTIAEVKTSVSSETGASLDSIRLIYKGKQIFQWIEFNIIPYMSLY